MSTRRTKQVVALAIAKQYDDARDKMQNVWYWHDVGRDVLKGAMQASQAVASVGTMRDNEAYLQAVLRSLDQARDEVRQRGDDYEGFMSGTIGSIQNDILRLVGWD